MLPRDIDTDQFLGEELWDRDSPEALEKESLAYKDQVVEELLDLVDEYLYSCGTRWELMKLLTSNF